MNLSRHFFLLLLLLWHPIAAYAGWGEDALQREANYICDSSYTEYAWNHGNTTPDLAGYGPLILIVLTFLLPPEAYCCAGN